MTKAGEDDSLKTVVINYYDIKVELNYNTQRFFNGSMKVQKENIIVFAADSFFSDYSSHEIVDLDGNGKNELVLVLTEGASPYIYNRMLIFDITLGPEPKFTMQNADLIIKPKELPKIDCYARMSPSVMGLGYNWLVEYRDKKIKYYKPKNEVWENMVLPDVESTRENLKQYKEGGFTCTDANYFTFFEAVMIQSLISGDDYVGLDFFDKYYKCDDKNSALKELKSASNNSFGWIKDSKNYEYSIY
ncbi:MAG: hypothetical protein IT281_00420 [Ignavibacteria bacterium]|nr:hypothetical protein [Ignavibacteria bacterium]